MRSQFIRQVGLISLIVGLIGIRWYTYPSPLPQGWTPESKIRFTALILEEPEYTDSQTIIRSGLWEIKIKGYAEIIPGETLIAVGRIEPKLLGGKIVKIVMKDPEKITQDLELKHQNGIGNLIVIGVGEGRKRAVGVLEKTLPEPMSSLAAGILLGVKRKMPWEFYQQLVATGTLHVVAASGFNVMIVAMVLMALAKQLWKRGGAIVAGMGGIWLYVLLAGGGAAVVRAGLMGSLTLMAYFWGRASEAKRLLWATVVVMLLINPLWLVDVGFQLSICATGGLLYLGPWIKKRADTGVRPYGMESWTKTPVDTDDPHRRPYGWLHGILNEYLYPTLAATIATAPVIWWHFGRIAWISPMVNMLVLPVVPLIMGLTAVVAGIGFIWLPLAQAVAWLTYIPLWWMVFVIRWWG